MEEFLVTCELLDFVNNHTADAADGRLRGFLKDRFKYEKEKCLMFASGRDLIGKRMRLTLEYHSPNDWISESCLPLTHSVSFSVGSRVDVKDYYAEFKEPRSYKIMNFNFYMEQHLVKDVEGNVHYNSDDSCLDSPNTVLIRRNDTEFSKSSIISVGNMFRILKEGDVDTYKLQQVMTIRDDMKECLILKASDSNGEIDIEMLFEKGKLLFEIGSGMLGETLQERYYNLDDDVCCTLYVKGENMLNELVWKGDIISKDRSNERLTIGKFTLCEDTTQ